MNGYTIASLKWEKRFTSISQEFRASTPFGSLWVDRHRKDWDESLGWEQWRWGYCFDEYYDEFSSDCKSSAEGKRLAQETWNSRLIECLKPLVIEDA